jgi:hypothetical protein
MRFEAFENLKSWLRLLLVAPACQDAERELLAVAVPLLSIIYHCIRTLEFDVRAV